MKGIIAICIESNKLEKDFDKLIKKHKLIKVPLMLGDFDCFRKSKKLNKYDRY